MAGRHDQGVHGTIARWLALAVLACVVAAGRADFSGTLLANEQTPLGTQYPHMFTTPSGGDSGTDNNFDTFFKGDTINATWIPGFVNGNYDLWVVAFNYTADNDFSQLLTKDVSLSQDGTYPWTIDLTTAQLAATSQYVFVFSPTSDSFVFTPAPDVDYVSTAFYVDSLDTSSTGSSSPAASASANSNIQSSASTALPTPSRTHQHGPSAASTSTSSATTVPSPPAGGIPAGVKAGVALGFIVGSALLTSLVWFLVRRFLRARDKRRAAEAEKAFVVLRVAKKPRRGGRGIRSHFWSVVPKDAASADAEGSVKGRELEAELETPVSPPVIRATSATPVSEGGTIGRAHAATPSEVLKAALGRKMMPGDVTIVQTAAPLVVRKNSGVSRSDVHQYGKSPPVELAGEPSEA